MAARPINSTPIVDAGKRQLWETGCFHNREDDSWVVLVKNLLVHWKYGQSIFWDTSNRLISFLQCKLAVGCRTGADATPYFRIFNPLTQSSRFDPNGDYIKKYIPELKNGI